MTRRDAVENRERVLEAAVAVVGEHGPSASTELIAERAGVGVGTVFRHFPTKQDLLAAVFEQLLTRIGDHARERSGEKDAGAAFFATLEYAVEQSATKKVVFEALVAGGMDLRKRAWAGGMREALTAALERAQAAGAVRRDVGIDEVMAVLAATTRAVEFAAPSVRAKTIEVLLDGLRPSGGRSGPRAARSRRG